MVTRGMPPPWITFNPSDLRCLIVLWLAGAANPANLADPSGNQPTVHRQCMFYAHKVETVPEELLSYGRLEGLSMRRFR